MNLHQGWMPEGTPKKPQGPGEFISSGPKKVPILIGAIAGLIPETFLNDALSNPDPQDYEIGWVAYEIPLIELIFDQAERGKSTDSRCVSICGLGLSDDPTLFLKLERIFQPGVINDIRMETMTQNGRTMGNFSFRIRPPVCAGVIQSTLLAFAIELENIGFTCRSPIDFNYRSAMENERSKQALEYANAESEMDSLMRMENVPCQDLTQAKQELDRILRNL